MEDEKIQSEVDEKDKIALGQYWFDKAVNQTKVGNFLEALLSIKNSTDFNPTMGAFDLKNHILLARKEFWEIISIMNNVARDNRSIYEEINGDFWIGISYQNVSGLEDAIRFYKKAISFSNYKGNAYINLSELLVKSGREKEAISFLKEASQLFPDWSTPFYYICYILWDHNRQDYTTSLVDFIKRFPNNGLEIMNLMSRSILDTDLVNDLKLPEKLFHYTSDTGLKGIIENRKLWLTRIDFLNDPSERNYFTKVLETMIDTAKQRGNKSQNVQWAKDLEVIKQLFVTINEIVYTKCELMECINRNYTSSGLSLKEFREIVRHFVKFGFDKYYVLSLTRKKDDLPLWAMYCKNEGYNVEFETSKLLECMVELQKDNRQLDSYVNLQSNVIYKHGKVYNFLKYLYDNYFIQISDFRTRITGLLSIAVVGSAFVKNEKFSFESESRIVIAKMYNPNVPETHSEVHFRVGNGTLIPYIEVPISNGTNWPIKSIRLGPHTTQKDTSLPGITVLVEKHGLPNIKVLNSDIPLR